VIRQFSPAQLGSARRSGSGHAPALFLPYLVLSSLTFMLYWKDNRSAERGAWRTLDALLHSRGD